MPASARLLAAALAAATALAAVPAVAADERTVWRVFVADQAAPTVTAFDLGTDARWTFPVKGPAKLRVEVRQPPFVRGGAAPVLVGVGGSAVPSAAAMLRT